MLDRSERDMRLPSNGKTQHSLRQRLASIGAGVILSLLTFPANAECSAAGCVGLVDQVYVEANGGLWVQTSGNETLANCTADSGVYLRLPAEYTRLKEVYATLLTAQVLGWQVYLRVVEGSNPCTIWYVSMNRQ